MKKTKDKEETKNKIIAILIGIIILLILILICVVSIKKFNNKDTNPNNEITNNNNITNENNNESNNDTTTKNQTNQNIIKDLSTYGEPNYNISTEEKNTDYTFKIQQDNSIIINNQNKISNIKNAKSIKLFNPPAPYSILYILTEDGNIYSYETSSYEENNYEATKINTYNNIRERSKINVNIFLL